MDSKTQNKRIFYRALQGIDLFVPCTAESDEALTIEVVRNDSGEVFVPAFFTQKSAKGHFADKTLAEYTFPQLREIVTKLPKQIRGIVIEPFEKEIVIEKTRFAEYDAFTKDMELSASAALSPASGSAIFHITA